MRSWRRRVIWTTALVVLIAVAIFAASRGGRANPTRLPEAASTDEPVDDMETDETVVQTIHPMRDDSLRVCVQQLATVEAFFQADLRSRVAGVVKYVAKDIGDPVRQGELLVEIDVPDLQQEIAQKESVVAQRRQELLLSKTHVKNADAAIDVAKVNITQKQTDVRQAAAMRDYHQKRLARFQQLANRTAITPDVVDEQTQSTLAAQAAEESAQVAVRRAQADLKEKEASREATLADVNLKEALITVSLKDLDRTRALADYARVTAPFDGVITRRKVDPGAFVQNSTTARTDGLLSVARTDLVTVTIKLPDNAAPFVTRNTEAEIHMDDLPGVSILGRVSRYSPLIEASDRTMRVEVDLFNGSELEYRAFRARSVACGLLAWGAHNTPSGLSALATGLCLIHQDNKGGSDEFPLRPTILGGGPSLPPLLPGMTGYMKLCLSKFSNAFLVPSSAVFSKGGKPYMLIVREGFSKLLPVKVQVNDGKLAKVAIMARSSDPNGGSHDVLVDLKGDENVITSRQLEIGEGRKVKVAGLDGSPAQ